MMTREEAYAKAQTTFGRSGMIGVNAQYPDAPFYVGSKDIQPPGARPGGSFWVKFGAGTTWEEAFENVKNVVKQLANGRFIFEGDEEDKK